MVEAALRPRESPLGVLNGADDLFAKLSARWEQANASWSAELTRPMMMFVLSAIAERAHDGAWILDAGCGDGHMTSIFASVGLHAVGVDVSREPTRRATAADTRQLFADARVEQLPFPDHSFDIVYSGSVLQYVDRPAALRETARVLRPGGLLVSLENLKGSPVAKLARLYGRLTRLQLAPNLTPRDHLRRRDLGLYGEYLRPTKIRAFNVLSPVVLVGDRLAARVSPRLAATASLYRYSHRIDRRLLDAAPALEHLAWNVVICAEK